MLKNLILGLAIALLPTVVMAGNPITAQAAARRAQQVRAQQAQRTSYVHCPQYHQSRQSYMYPPIIIQAYPPYGYRTYYPYQYRYPSYGYGFYYQSNGISLWIR